LILPLQRWDSRPSAAVAAGDIAQLLRENGVLKASPSAAVAAADLFQGLRKRTTPSGAHFADDETSTIPRGRFVPGGDAVGT
jgi:hypothetical protein